MDIKLELSKEEAELLVIARNKDVNVKSYSEDGLKDTATETVKGLVFEMLANFELQRITEIKKYEMQQWLQNKMKPVTKEQEVTES